MVDWLGVPQCDSNMAVLWLVLAIFLPGIAQIIAGAVHSHTDSIIIGVVIIVIAIVLPVLAFIAIVVISILTFGAGSVLGSFYGIVYIVPIIYSLIWVFFKSLKVFREFNVFQRIVVVVVEFKQEIQIKLLNNHNNLCNNNHKCNNNNHSNTLTKMDKCTH
jgi:hypothetical protein